MKIFAFDIDGTLLTSTKEVSQSTLEVLHHIEESGDKWLLATGRSYEMIQPILDNIKMKCDCITNSGHLFVDKYGHDGLKFSMPNPVLYKVIEILLNYDFHISLHSDKGKYIFGDKESYFARHIEISKSRHKENFNKIKNAPLFVKELFLKNTHSINNINELVKHNVHILKIDARNMEPTLLDIGMKELNKIDEIVIHSSYEAFLEISEKSSNKAIMLNHIINTYGAMKEDVYVFGDSMNDIELFQEFPNSIAMGNADDKIKALAKWVTDTNDNNGIAKAFQNYNLS